MTVIDAHQHFWRHGERARSWPPPVAEKLARDFTPDDLLPELRQAGVDGTVLVQTVNDPDETHAFLELAQSHPFIRGVVGWLALDAPDAAAATIADLQRRGPIVGFRHGAKPGAPADWMLAPEVVASLATIARADMAFETVPLDAVQFEHVLTLAARLPELRVVVDHLGRPPVPEQGFEPWAGMIARAAAVPNVTLKLSIGMDVVTRWRWDTAALPRYVDHAVACFGADRIMLASNWPVVLLAGSYQQAWGGMTELTAGLPESDRAAILGGTAMRVYRLRQA